MQDPPNPPLVLASASTIRARLLSAAGLEFSVHAARVDEQSVRQSHLAEGGNARDLADHLAEIKALKTAARNPDALVIGADQVLECQGRLLAKPDSPAEAREHLSFLAGRTHRLLSAVVVARDGTALWRHVGEARLTMHPLSGTEIDSYLARNWDSIRHAVGCYKIEEDGIRLFSRVEGDFFHILGLPLIELLTWLRIRGDISA